MSGCIGTCAWGGNGGLGIGQVPGMPSGSRPVGPRAGFGAVGGVAVLDVITGRTLDPEAGYPAPARQPRVAASTPQQPRPVTAISATRFREDGEPSPALATDAVNRFGARGI